MAGPDGPRPPASRLGIDVRTIDSGLPSAFSIGYTITDIAPNDDYVVTAEVGDGGAIWRNAAGVPVITNGNPKSGIEVVVAQVVAAGASPSPSASPTPSASPVPTTADELRQDRRPPPWIVVIVLIAAVAAFFIARGRESRRGAPARRDIDDRGRRSRPRR
jgi:hypothetical protein